MRVAKGMSAATGGGVGVGAGGGVLEGGVTVTGGGAVVVPLFGGGVTLSPVTGAFGSGGCTAAEEFGSPMFVPSK